MKIMIHGAVYRSNFGDCLYAQIYNDYIKTIPCVDGVYFLENRWYGASEHLKGLSDISTEVSVDKMDALVYMPGGYFGEGPSAYRRWKQYMRYFRLGKKFIKKDKKVLVSAIGGERVNSKWLLGKINYIFQNAELITTRNVRTAEFFQPYTPVKITPLFDVILHVGKMDLGTLPVEVTSELNAAEAKGQKKIFLHIHGKDAANREIEEKILPAINRYALETGAHVFVGTDYVSGQNLAETSVYRNLKCSKSVYRYSSPLELCAFLKRCDLIVTPKLHVGVVSATLGKSVISAALVPTKTKAFYEDIGCAERSVALKDATPEIVYENIVKFADVPIAIPTELVERAEENLVLLRQAIEGLSVSGNVEK